MTSVHPHRISAVDEPTIPAGVLALSLAALAHGLLVQPGTERRALMAALGGVLLLASGYEAWQRRHRLLGAMLLVGGTALVAFGVLSANRVGSELEHRLVLLTGVIGIIILGCGLIPPLGQYARPVAFLGAGLVFLGIITSGILETASLFVLLVATCATIAAWDMADHAIGLGNQVGRNSPTVRVTVVHLAGTLTVAAILLLGTFTIASLVEIGLSTGALVLLLVSCSALFFALRH